MGREAFATGGTTVWSVTLTGEYKAVGGLITRFEFRTDFSDEPFFPDDDASKKNQTTLTLAFIYAFSSNRP